jgi:glyoxylase I family protein
MFTGVHHIAIIASDYQRSKAFYTATLGLRIVSETYRSHRDSWKLNLALPDGVEIELFSFPNPPARPSRPEAAGLRHLALRTANFDATLDALLARDVMLEPVRIDELTGKRFTFLADPDGLPIEIYES